MHCLLEINHLCLVVFKLCLELSDFLLSLLHFGTRLTVKIARTDLININCGLNMLCLLSKVQSVHCLLVVRECLSHCADNGCFRIPAQSCLKYSGELRVSEVDEGLATTISRAEAIDHIRKSKETSVDIGTLSQP